MAKDLVVDVKGLCNEFGGTIIQKDLNFEVNKGKIVAIVGASGSGKTTLLRSIMRLQKPSAGTIKVFGEDIIGARAKVMQSVRERWGVLFQQGALFSSLTILENVAFPMHILTNVPKQQCYRLAAVKLDMVGLPERAATLYSSELSGGMKKRAGLARALMMDPELLMLDEPTSGLDPDSAEQFNQLLLDLRATLGFTVIMVSHDLTSLNTVADEVAFIADKRVVAMAPMTKLMAMDNHWVQEFFKGLLPHGGARGYADG